MGGEGARAIELTHTIRNESQELGPHNERVWGAAVAFIFGVSSQNKGHCVSHEGRPAQSPIKGCQSGKERMLLL